MTRIYGAVSGYPWRDFLSLCYEPVLGILQSSCAELTTNRLLLATDSQSILKKKHEIEAWKVCAQWDLARPFVKHVNSQMRKEGLRNPMACPRSFSQRVGSPLISVPPRFGTQYGTSLVQKTFHSSYENIYIQKTKQYNKHQYLGLQCSEFVQVFGKLSGKRQFHVCDGNETRRYSAPAKDNTAGARQSKAAETQPQQNWMPTHLGLKCRILAGTESYSEGMDELFGRTNRMDVLSSDLFLIVQPNTEVGIL